MERFWSYVAGDDGWNQLAPALRARLRAGASTLFGIELGTYERYLPDDATLAAIPVPVRLLVSEQGLPVFAEIAGRLGKRLGEVTSGDVSQDSGDRRMTVATHGAVLRSGRPFRRGEHRDGHRHADLPELHRR